MKNPMLDGDTQTVVEELPPGVARALPLWEIASVLTSGLIVEWAVLAFIGRNKLVMAIPLGLTFALMLYSHRERAETPRDLGLRTDNFLASCRMLLFPTALGVLLIITFGWFTGHGHFGAPWRWRFAALPLWALFQQYALNGFINRRAQLALGAGQKSIVLVAVAFSLLHLPNPMLALLTLVAGAFWAFVYQRAPNLYALAISHSLASLALALTVSPHWLNGLRVGFKYFG
jgi:membrane protease YdiL (CAAX protease family)